MTRQTHKISFEPLPTLKERALKEGKKEIRRCTKCLMVETNETMSFNENGVCNICQSFIDREKWDTEAREKEFSTILEKYRGKYPYDAIVPFSGGKDSAWVAYVLVKRYKMKILLATYDSNFRRPEHLRNIDRVVRALGVDHITFRSNQEVIRKAMLETLKRKGDFCWYCHTGVCVFPIRTAIMYKVPLVVWGEPSSEYAAYYGYKNQEVEGERSFNRLMNLSINAEDMLGFIDGVEMRDLEPYRYPRPEELQELKKMDYLSICMGDFIKWNPIKQVEILNKELGWETAEVEGLHPMYGGEKVECYLQGVRDYLRYIKRGYSRTCQRANIEIRRNRVSRQEGLKQIEYDARKPASLGVILDFLGITEKEFIDIVYTHSISPWVYDPKMAKDGPPLPDHEQWKESLKKHA
jgi:N-acetyl sugar amidotransferase